MLFLKNPSFVFYINGFQVEMLTVLDLESTDLGPGAYAPFSGWIENKVAGRCVALWLADRLESCVRLRFGDTSPKPAMDPASGFDPSLSATALRLYDEFFSLSASNLIDRAVETFCAGFSPTVGKINASFRRLSLEARCSSSISTLRTLHVYLEIIRADLYLKSDYPRPRAPLLDIDLESRSSHVSLTELHNAMDDYLLLLLKFKSGLKLVATQYCPYSVLGLSPGASLEEVKKAYKRLAMHAHPDKGGTKELFQGISEAYEAITKTGGMDFPEENIEVQTQHEEEVRVVPTDLLANILKSAETCVSSAEVFSKDLAKASGKACGLACLEVSAFGLKLDQLVSAAEECMNAGFDLLNKIDEVDRDGLVLLANKCAQLATSVARIAAEGRTPEKPTRKEPPEIPKGPSLAEQMQDNWDLFVRLNTELLSFKTTPSVQAPDLFLMATLHDHMRYVVSSKDIKHACHVFAFNRPRTLAYSTEVLLRATQYLINTSPRAVKHSIETVLIPCTGMHKDFFSDEIHQINKLITAAESGSHSMSIE